MMAEDWLYEECVKGCDRMQRKEVEGLSEVHQSIIHNRPFLMVYVAKPRLMARVQLTLGMCGFSGCVGWVQWVCLCWGK